MVGINGAHLNHMHIHICSSNDRATYMYIHTPFSSLSHTLIPSQHPDAYESLDDNFFTADVSSTSDDASVRAMKRPLMPQGCGPDVALQHFARNFEQRYGPTHPLFYVGALSAAVKEATSGSASSGTVGHV